ncbi:hypothetical protein ES703_70642 [subsurface metagenome]
MIFLITGIGCIGKSSLREKIASDFPDQVISVDMDYDKEIPRVRNKIVIVESVHGLEDNPKRYDKILYLQSPHNHFGLWLKRAWTWFATGIVDFSTPKGKMKRYSFYNIPIILKILARNIFLRNKWINNDLNLIQNKFRDRAQVVSSIDEGYEIIKSWINY